MPESQDKWRPARVSRLIVKITADPSAIAIAMLSYRGRERVSSSVRFSAAFTQAGQSTRLPHSMRHNAQTKRPQESHAATARFPSWTKHADSPSTWMASPADVALQSENCRINQRAPLYAAPAFHWIAAGG